MEKPEHSAQSAQEKNNTLRQKPGVQARTRAQQGASAKPTPPPAPAKMSGARTAVVAGLVVAALGGISAATVWVMGKNRVPPEQTRFPNRETSTSAPVKDSAAVPVQNPASATVQAPVAALIPVPAPTQATIPAAAPVQAPALPMENPWKKIADNNQKIKKPSYFAEGTVSAATPAKWSAPKVLSAQEAFDAFPIDLDLRRTARIRKLSAINPQLTLVLIRQMRIDPSLPAPQRYSHVPEVRTCQKEIVDILEALVQRGIATAVQVEDGSENLIQDLRVPLSPWYTAARESTFVRLTPQEINHLGTTLKSRMTALSAGLSKAASGKMGSLSPRAALQLQKMSEALSAGANAQLQDGVIPQEMADAGHVVLDNLRKTTNEGPLWLKNRGPADLALNLRDVGECAVGYWQLEEILNKPKYDPLFGAVEYALWRDTPIAVLQSSSASFDASYSGGDERFAEERKKMFLKYAAHPDWFSFGSCRAAVMDARLDFFDQIALHNQTYPEFPIALIELTPTAVATAKIGWINVVGGKKIVKSYDEPAPGDVPLPPTK